MQSTNIEVLEVNGVKFVVVVGDDFRAAEISDNEFSDFLMAIVPDVIDELTALRAKVAAGRKLREAIRCGYCVDELEKCAACKAMAEYDAAVQCGTI